MDIDTRLRVGRVIGKTEEEIAPKIMEKLKRHNPAGPPPALATDGKGAYRESMLETWGKVPEYNGQGRPPTVLKPGDDWQYLQVIKRREGSKIYDVTLKVVYGNKEEVMNVLGKSTAYVERTHLTSRQMNGRLVRKTLSFSKELRFLKASTALEDALYNFKTSLCQTTRQKVLATQISMTMSKPLLGGLPLYPLLVLRLVPTLVLAASPILAHRASFQLSYRSMYQPLHRSALQPSHRPA